MDYCEYRSFGLLRIQETTSNPLLLGYFFDLSAHARRISIPFAMLISSRPFLPSNEKHTNKKALEMPSIPGLCICVFFADKSYLLLNCGARLAALRPGFLRSFIRGSRVKNPAFFKIGRYSSEST